MRLTLWKGNDGRYHVCDFAGNTCSPHPFDTKTDAILWAFESHPDADLTEE